MKCLTLTQPWATLVAIGAKHIETRSWATSYRGPLAIHAAKGYPDRGLRFEEPFYSALWQVGIKPDMAIPTGAIIAVCDLHDCVPTRQSWHREDTPWLICADAKSPAVWHVPPPEPERSFGDYTSGRFAWLLANIRELPEPVPCKGALSLWQPDTLTEMAVTRQLIAGVRL